MVKSADFENQVGDFRVLLKVLPAAACICRDLTPTDTVVCAGYDPETGEIPDDYVEPEWEQIPTMLFHFYDELDEFSFIAPKLEAAIAQKRQELGDEAEDMHDMEILTEHLDSLGSVPLVFCITLGGMACGPVSSSTYVGLDLAAAYQK